MQLGANEVAARTPCQAAAGCGFFQRSAPVGGAANGMPLNAATPFAATPCTSPPVTLAVRTCAAAEKLRDTRTAATHAPYSRCFMLRLPRLIRRLIGAREPREPLEARDRNALLRHQLADELLGLGLRARRLPLVRGNALRP